MVHRFPVTVHLLVLASCGLKLYFQIDGLRARSQEGGLEEYSVMAQDSDPGLKANVNFVYFSFIAVQAVYGLDVVAMQLCFLAGLVALLWWVPLCLAELMHFLSEQRIRGGQRGRVTNPPLPLERGVQDHHCPHHHHHHHHLSARWRLWALAYARSLILALCGAIIAGAWVGRLPIFRATHDHHNGWYDPTGGLTLPAGTSAENKRPNLLFILADDMRALGPYVNLSTYVRQVPSLLYTQLINQPTDQSRHDANSLHFIHSSAFPHTDSPNQPTNQPTNQPINQPTIEPI